MNRPMSRRGPAPRRSRLRTWFEGLTPRVRGLLPRVEPVEDRVLLATTQAGFLAGTVFSEGANPQPLAGATILLYPAGSTTAVAQAVTDSRGYYEIDDVAPGSYLLKEVPPSGYVAAAGTTIRSQLNPATPGAEPGTINVTVADSSQVFVDYQGVVASSSLPLQVSVRGVTKVNTVGPLAIALGSSPSSSDLSGTSFNTLCVDNLQDLSYGGGETFQVVPRPIDALTDGLNTISADHAGRIAYLFNHYAGTNLDAVNGTALQLAVWELLYDSGNTPDFTAGAFQVVGTYPPTEQAQLDAALAQATAFYNESAGKKEPAVFLDAGAANPGQTESLQGMLATNFLGFTAKKVDCTCTCTCDVRDICYVINGCKVVTSLAGNVRLGDVVEARFTVPEGCKETISFVSYTSKYGYCDPKYYSGLSVYSHATQEFCAGEHALKIHIPCNNFEADLVCGKVLHAQHAHNGTTYEAEGRLIEQVKGNKPYKGKTSPQAGQSFKDGNSWTCQTTVCQSPDKPCDETPSKPVPPSCPPVACHTTMTTHAPKSSKPFPSKCLPVVHHAAPRPCAPHASKVLHV